MSQSIVQLNRSLLIFDKNTKLYFFILQQSIGCNEETVPVTSVRISAFVGKITLCKKDKNNFFWYMQAVVRKTSIIIVRRVQKVLILQKKKKIYSATACNS